LIERAYHVCGDATAFDSLAVAKIDSAHFHSPFI
jgi:hypothetical protein